MNCVGYDKLMFHEHYAFYIPQNKEWSFPYTALKEECL